jgi:WD40 repeat protein
MKFQTEGGAFLSVTFSPDGQRLASGGQDKAVRLWNMKSGKESQTLLGHNGPVRSVAFSADGKKVASGSDDFTTLIWKVAP